jgi:ERAP1-like protein
VNAGQTGFFRVKYSAALLGALRTALESGFTALTASDRAGLVDDVFALALTAVSGTV